MKRLIVVAVGILFAAELAFAQAGAVCLFRDAQGNNCTITDTAPGLITVYVVHMQASNVMAVEFMAPVPPCMIGAIWLGDTPTWPIVIGSSQTGMSVAYGECSSSPVLVTGINIFGLGQTLPDCPYQVLPHPTTGGIRTVDCDQNLLDAAGGTTFINPFSLDPCVCGEAGPPLLYVAPTTLDFGETLTAKTFTIGNTGGGLLTWNVSESVPWLDATPTSGSGGGAVTVHVDRAGLVPGSYSALISVTSNGGNETVTANMQVPVPTPVLGVTPASLTFTATQTAKTLTVFNGGVGDLDWTITSDRTWLTATPASGTNDTEVMVEVDRTGLPDATYNGSLVVSSDWGSVTVSVSVVVDTQPVLTVNPSFLVLTPAATTGTFLIKNTGYGTLEWSLSADQSWIEIVPPLVGTGNATVTVNVDVGSVPGPGNQFGYVTVTSNGGTKQVTVQYQPAGPQLGGMIGVFADAGAAHCNIYDSQPGLLKVYVVHVNMSGAAGSQFAAPKPSCMIGAEWLADENMFPVVVGNSQVGMSVGYGGCRLPPIHVLTIDYFATGVSQVCCTYPVIPDPNAPSGMIEVADCGFNVVYGTGGMCVVNPDVDCGCDTEITVQETTWGHVKALYAPE